jgi:glyoxylase-like metal-dependent hydrolase (beta-lactamase superfamily II)
MNGNPEWKIGDVMVTTVIERFTEVPRGDFLPTTTDDALAGHRDWLYPWAVDDAGQLLFVIQAVCLDVGGQRIVVDTCIGPRQLPEIYAAVANDGSFIRSFGDAGFGRDDVDLVICTHLHFDHVGWNTVLEDGKWVPTFRKARYLIVRPEYEYWKATSEEKKAASNVFNFDDAVTPLLEAGVVDLVGSDHRVGGAIWLVPTPGHTPGHVSVRITSQGEDALVTGDCAHHPVQLAEPTWYSVADGDPEMSTATRRRIVGEYVDTPVVIIGTHFRPPAAGHLVTAEGGVRFRPAGGPLGPVDRLPGSGL